MNTLNYYQLLDLPEDFDYNKVIKINLDEYNLTRLNELNLERFINLRELNCNDNKLTDLDCLSNCTSLQVLWCSNNKLSNLDWLSNCTSLKKLYCNDNKLSNIDGIANCISLRELNCSDNKLTDLDCLSNCTSLQELECSHNQLSNLDFLSNCTSLQYLDCCFNKLSNLDGLSICTSLQELYCQCNQISNLDCLSNCTSLQKLYCSGNKLSNLDCLSNCTSLQQLWCSNNKLSNLDCLSNCTSLQYLDCCLNQLSNLDCLSNCTSLQELNCSNNQLTTLLPIRNLRNLNYVRYYNNPFEGPQHPAVLRILDGNKSIGNNIYSDSQNVHDSEITKSVNTSINNLLKAHSKSLKSENEIINKLIDFKFSRIEDLMTYFKIEDIHSYFNLTYFEIFQLVFSEIEHLDYSPEILRRLEEELNDASCMCFTGRISRTVNSLSGFSDLVSVNISETSQINAVMTLIKNDFENNKIKEEELLDTVRNKLKEYNINEETIKFYQDIFHEMYLS